MIIITSGNKNLDIDAYASGIAYEKLLNEIGKPAKFISTANFNTSISSLILSLNFNVQTNYIASEEDTFIVQDVSGPETFDKIVDKNKIIEIIDHHKGYEDIWKNCNFNCQIEYVGAVATLIFEKFVEYNKTDILTQDLCKLLISAILDNTLNLKSSATTDRDIEAYNQLQKIGNLTQEFDKEYFISCQEEINKDVISAVKGDIRTDFVKNLLPEHFGQLLVYDINPILDKLKEIDFIFNDKEWLINIINISDGKSYIYTSNKSSQINLEKLLNKKFKNNFIILNKFKLRKEIIALDIENMNN